MPISFGKLKDLEHGDLNNLKENDGNPSGDRRRTKPATALRMAAEKAFEKSSLKSIDEFQGVVVGKRRIDYATAQYPATVLAAEAAGEQSTFINYLYRVYIPELEPLRPPESDKDPILGGYQEIPTDALLDPNITFNLGDVVKVRYQDAELLNNPRIVKKISRRPPNWSSPTSPNSRPSRPGGTVQRTREAAGTVPSQDSTAPTSAPTPPAPGGSGAARVRSEPGEPCDNPEGYPPVPAWTPLTPPEAWAKRNVSARNANRSAKLNWDDTEILIPPLAELLDWIAAHEGKVNSTNRTYGGDTPGDNGAWISGGPLRGRNFETLKIEEVSSLMMGYKSGGSWNPPGSNARYVIMDRTAGDPKSDKTKLHGDNQNPPDDVLRRWLNAGLVAQSNAAWKNNGFYTAGRFQFIPSTFRFTVKKYFTTAVWEKDFDRTGQDKLGVSLLFRKQPKLGGYLLGLHDNVGLAAWQYAAEWASGGIPFKRWRKPGSSTPVLQDLTPGPDEELLNAGQSYWASEANTQGNTGHTPCDAVHYLKRARWNLLNDIDAVRVLRAAGFTVNPDASFISDPTPQTNVATGTPSPSGGSPT